MNIYLYGKNYQMTTTNVIDNELYMYLKDDENHLFKKSVSDIILLLYKNKAESHFSEYETLQDLQKELMQVDKFLSDVEEYQYIKKVTQKLTIKQEELNQTFREILQSYSNWKKEQEKELLNVQQNITGKNETNNKFQHMSENELMFQLQMYPNSPDCGLMREELERRSNMEYQETHHTPTQSNEVLKVKKLEHCEQMRGFVMNTFLSFCTGILVGIWILVLINLLMR